MRVIGIKVLKNKLSEYIRLAANGETILVTDRDKVVAEITPPNAARAETGTDAMLADLVRKGLFTPALDRSRLPPPRTPVMSSSQVMAELDERRQDR
jgi:antitoxin (DNA-binding transcriptional repressor) of toxin-antitoxin stability system